MSKESQKKYFRMTKAERASIERKLDSESSARSMAKDLGRAPSAVTEEIKRNRTVCKGPGKGERVDAIPEGEKICPKLEVWPGVCNGCKLRRYHCSYKWRCEYSASRAQALAHDLLVSARRGVNAREESFEDMMACVRADVARGLSPALIAHGRSGEFKVDPSTIYRWIAKGYGGMSNAELRRKVGYKPRRASASPKQTSHGQDRSYQAFCELDEDTRAAACEMDTVIGRSRDTQCILTLYLRSCGVQIALLLPNKSSSAVAAALDMIEHAIGQDAFARLFKVILTDNGTEFAATESLERSVTGKTVRCKVYYCDIRQSQQKGRCERNHVELRKLLPKGCGISFDKLDERDMACVMSQLNSEPRGKFAGLSPIKLMKAAMPDDAESFLDVLGIEDIAYGNLNLTVEAIHAERRKRGLPDLI